MKSIISLAYLAILVGLVPIKRRAINHFTVLSLLFESFQIPQCGWHSLRATWTVRVMDTAGCNDDSSVCIEPWQQQMIEIEMAKVIRSNYSYSVSLVRMEAFSTFCSITLDMIRTCQFKAIHCSHTVRCACISRQPCIQTKSIDLGIR